MKKLLFLAPIIAAGLAVSVQAGETVVPTASKNVVAPASPEVFGTGFYLGVDMGANVYQDRGGNQTFRDEFGDTLQVDPKNDVGFYGGIKAGYVFGQGIFRPTLEQDLFYNGFRGGADTILTVNGAVTKAGATTFINTGAFMSNFIMKFAFQRFQPYFGAGVGVYYAESAGIDINGPRGTFNGGGGQSHADFAWQVIAGTDYYFTSKISTFVEYHYLDYTSSQIDTSQSRDLGQSLVGAGIRFHF